MSISSVLRQALKEVEDCLGGKTNAFGLGDFYHVRFVGSAEALGADGETVLRILRSHLTLCVQRGEGGLCWTHLKDGRELWVATFAAPAEKDAGSPDLLTLLAFPADWARLPPEIRKCVRLN